VNRSIFRPRSAVAAAVAVAAMLSGVPDAPAWEAATTHAGLTEQAAAASRLHERLRKALGVDRGLYEALTVPPKDAPALFQVLRQLDPSHGYVPDARGRLLALGWLSAGAVLADIPAAQAANHFFDPATGKGATGLLSRGLGACCNRGKARIGEELPDHGDPAPAWVEDKENPFRLEGFLDQYQKAVRAKTPGERSRHVAGALLAAGAILHVLQDMGSPSHVRGDLAAHFDPVSDQPDDRGSRFERIAALAYGRLGVPPAVRVVSAATLRAFFTAADGSGLADRTASRWFSAHTLPRPISIGSLSKRTDLADKLKGSLRRPSPTVPTRLNLLAAQKGAVTISDIEGVCLARYAVVDGRLSWTLDDACALQQLGSILPEVAGYSAGLLDWLFRGQLEIASGGGARGNIAVSAGAVPLGAGTLELFSEDGRGVRAPMGAPMAISAGAAGAALTAVPAPPEGTRRVAALFHGVDAVGQPLVAAAVVFWPPGSSQAPAVPATPAVPPLPTTTEP
jgi:hypothetical protein